MSFSKYLSIIILVTTISTANGSLMTEIDYDLQDLGGGRWQYEYQIRNISLTESVAAVTIFFDKHLYSDLQVATADIPVGWMELPIQPQPSGQPGWDGRYEIWTDNIGIGVDGSIGWFSISFNFSGAGMPGAQSYHILDPSTFDDIDRGDTQYIPEPVSMLLLGSGSLIWLGRGRRRARL